MNLTFRQFASMKNNTPENCLLTETTTIAEHEMFKFLFDKSVCLHVLTFINERFQLTNKGISQKYRL